jgi:hypothetical protein
MVTVSESASVTSTENEYVAFDVGTPLITPFELSRLKPGGKEPLDTLKTYGEVPPEAVTVCEKFDWYDPNEGVNALMDSDIHHIYECHRRPSLR